MLSRSNLQRFAVLNLVGRGSISIYKQVHTCYGCADEKPLLGFHRE